MASVAALYCLQKSIVCTPWGPSAVPTGGAGVALPAGSWILTMAATRRLAISLPYVSKSADEDTRRPPEAAKPQLLDGRSRLRRIRGGSSPAGSWVLRRGGAARLARGLPYLSESAAEEPPRPPEGAKPPFLDGRSRLRRIRGGSSRGEGSPPPSKYLELRYL